METWLKELIFFILVFVLFGVFSKVFLEINQKANINLHISMLISAVLYTVILLGIYSLLARIKSEGFRFEVTPAKKCGLWPYVSPPDFDCSTLSESEIRQYNCCPGFTGRPVQFKYTPESNAQWENKRCESKPSFNVAVL